MNQSRLSETLHEIADQAALPSTQLANSAWATGRSARRIERRHTVVAAVALMLCLGVLWQLSSPLRTLAPSGGTGSRTGEALPARVFAPDRVDQVSPGDPSLETDLALGRVSIATTFGIIDTPLLVTARDGKHHLVALPGFARVDGAETATGGDPVVALSPDGWRLAYQQIEARGRTTPVRTSLAVVDLRTGGITSLEIAGPRARPIAISQIVWSPHGQRLAWFGDEAVQWDESASVHAGPKREVGLLDADLSNARQWTIGRASSGAALAVGDTGPAYLMTERRLRLLPASGGTPTSRVVIDSRQGWTTGAAAPDGQSVVFGANDGSKQRVWSLPAGEGTNSQSKLRALAAEGQPLGFSPDGTLTTLANEPLPPNTASDGQDTWRIALPRGEVRSTLSPAYVSIATELADQEPRAVPEPKLPLTDGQKAGLVAAALLALGCSVWLVRYFLRRRR